MKILYGITKSNFGGAQRYVFDLATEMRRRGHDVTVLCGEGDLLANKLQKENIRTITIPGFRRDMDLFGDAFRLLFIIKAVWREKPQVFHINSAKMGGAGIFAGRLCGVPNIIFTAHGWAFNENRPKWQKILIRFFTWMTIFSAHKTICVSNKTKEQIKNFPLIQKKLLVIYNGLKPFPLAPRAEARKFLDPDADETTLLIGALSELHYIKGLDTLFRAWQKSAKGRKVKLIIMGEGEERKPLEGLIQILEIKDSVILKGYLDNARQYLSGLDIFVMPSRSEAMPYAPIEAGFAGLPVIATTVGGIPEIIENNLSGILVPPENPEAIIEALRMLFNDKGLSCDRLGENLSKRVKEKFSIEKMVEETLKIYQGLL